MLRFYGNLTQAEIGARLGLSQMHVSRLLERALAYLRGKITEPA
jgi:RNA polymerase sigma-B factor